MHYYEVRIIVQVVECEDEEANVWTEGNVEQLTVAKASTEEIALDIAYRLEKQFDQVFKDIHAKL